MNEDLDEDLNQDVTEDQIQGIMEYLGLEGLPNMAHYIAIHGVRLDSIMSIYNVKAPYKDREEVYAACIERGCTWQELLDFKGYDENILY